MATESRSSRRGGAVDVMWALAVLASIAIACEMSPEAPSTQGTNSESVAQDKPRRRLPAPDEVRASIREGEPKWPARSSPTIVLVTIDTLRKRNVSYFGHDKKTTPYLDGLLSQGIVFDLQAAAPWTVPSLASILTGVPFSFHQAGVIRTPSRAVDSLLSSDVTTLAEVLQRSGYVTCALVTNGHLLEQRQLGFSRGFDYFYAFGDKHHAKHVGEALDAVSDLSRVRGVEALLGGAGTRLLTLFRGFARKEHARGTFFWIHLFEPHNPFKQRNALLREVGHKPPPAPDGALWLTYDARQVFRNGEGEAPQELVDATRTVYDGEVRETDRILQGIHEHLQSVAQDAWLVVTTDHGEELFERGSADHGHTLYQELLDSFLLVHRSGVKARRGVGLARHVDVMPTVCALAELDCPSPRARAGEWAGASLLDEGAAPQPAFSENPELFEDRAAVRIGSDKLVLHLRSRRYELFDLSSDPGEQYAIHDDARAAPLIARIDALLSQRTAQKKAAPPSRELEERLRALGYAR